MKSIILFQVLLAFAFSSVAQEGYMTFTIDSADYKIELDPGFKGSMMIGGGSKTLVSGSDGKSMSVSCMFPGTDTAHFELTGSYAAPMVTISMSANSIYLVQEGVLIISEYTEDKWVTGKFYGKAKLTSGSDELVEVSGKFHLHVQ